MHRPRRQADPSWSEDTPAPGAREAADTLPLGTQARAPHWTQVDTAADGTPVILHDAPAASGERSFLAEDEATVEAAMRFDDGAPATLPLGSAAAPALPVTREAPATRASGALSTALPPRRPTVWAPRSTSERPPSAEGPPALRTTLLVTLGSVLALVALGFAYLVLAAPE